MSVPLSKTLRLEKSYDIMDQLRSCSVKLVMVDMECMKLCPYNIDQLVYRKRLDASRKRLEASCTAV